jgi:hypothetical protein
MSYHKQATSLYFLDSIQTRLRSEEFNFSVKSDEKDRGKSSGNVLELLSVPLLT